MIEKELRKEKMDEFISKTSQAREIYKILQKEIPRIKAQLKMMEAIFNQAKEKLSLIYPLEDLHTWSRAYHPLIDEDENENLN